MSNLENSRTISLKLWIVIPMIVILSACYPVQASSIDLEPPVLVVQPTASPSLEPARDPQPNDLKIVPLIEPAPSAPEEPPLELTFPNAEPVTDLAWRPPLYEVPWGLSPHDHFYFQRPIQNDGVTWMWENYRYGDYFPETEIVHTGIDLIAERGTPILAVASGKVVWAGSGISRGALGEEDPYGLAVAILHDFGVNQRQIQTIYGHMDRVDVKVGDYVEAGDSLGIVGDTGFATGPHLHFEVRVEEGEFFVTRNPELWIAPPQGWGVLAARLMKKDGTPFYHLEVKVRSLETDRVWTVRTYGPLSANPDDYYNENVVLTDLPAGEYEVKFRYYWITQTTTVNIVPGAVTYFTFRNSIGFSYDLPTASDEITQLIPDEIN